MKPSAVEVVVADTGPLIALARLELLDLPIRLFQRVVVTTTVLSECKGKPDRGEGQAVDHAVAAAWLSVCDDPAGQSAWGLDAGETSAIAWAMAHHAGLLIDEKAGRSVAARLGCRVIGTAGLLVLAKRRGQVPHVLPLLESLQRSGYFLSPAVIDEAGRLAGEA